MLSMKGDAQGVEQPGQGVVEGLKMLQDNFWQRGHHWMVFVWVYWPSCVSNFSPHTLQSNICRFGNSSLTSLRGDTCLDCTLSGLLHLNLRKLLTFVSFPLVYLHTSLRFEAVSTNVTLECVFSLLWQSHLRLNISIGRHRIRYRVLPLSQEGLLVPDVSPESWRACLLLGLAWTVRGQTLIPCLKGEGEGWSDLEGEVEGQALAYQRLAEVQTFDCQGGITFTHSCHFGVLLNQRFSGDTR